MKFLTYNREKAVNYAVKWAYGRNLAYVDFENMGGDCTNFVSQCIYAGTGVMNYTKTFGWYYNSINDRSPAWSSAKYLNKFLLENKGAGPYGELISLNKIMLGDIIQLVNANGEMYHSLIVTKIYGEPSLFTIFVTAHSFDSKNRAFSSYNFASYNAIHILGARQW